MKSKFITTHDSTCNYVVKELILCNIELNKLDELSQELILELFVNLN